MGADATKSSRDMNKIQTMNLLFVWSTGVLQVNVESNYPLEDELVLPTKESENSGTPLSFIKLGQFIVVNALWEIHAKSIFRSFLISSQNLIF